jgi:hypothetical protein
MLRVGKLISALDEQEERAKNAKEIKPTKPAAATTASSDVKKSSSKGSTRWRFNHARQRSID